MKRIYVVCIAIALVFLWLLTPVVLRSITGSAETAGQIGDMFGAANALFSGLALLGAVYAIMLQSEELALQREELRKSTEEFKAQNDILREQLKISEGARSASEIKEHLASLPFFDVTSSGGRGSRWDNFRVLNSGADAFKVYIEAQDDPKLLTATYLEVWKRDERKTVTFESASAAPIDKPYVFTVHYTTVLGRTGRIKFEAPGNGGSPVKAQLPLKAEMTDEIA